jgi:ribosome-associated protein
MIAPGVYVPESALEFSFSSSSGPGGQNVNKRATKATLRLGLLNLPIPGDALERLRGLGSHFITGEGELLIQCDEHRSQERNREGCLERLRELLVAALRRPKVRRATRPTRGSKERRLTEKKQRGETKRRRRDESA